MKPPRMNTAAPPQHAKPLPSPAEFIRAQDWPHWPRLPMKRSSHDLGCLAVVNGVYTIFHCTLYQDITDTTRKTAYATPEAVLADGWRID